MNSSTNTPNSDYKGLKRPFFVLAPMDDVTDTVFRQIVASTAAPDMFFTEFVNVDGLQSPGRTRLLPKLKLEASDKPVIAQIWGKKPENYYKTVKDLIRMGFDGVDINMGCPVKTVIKDGCCSALINDRELAGEIIQATQEAAGEDFPVSVKTRVGFTTIDLSWIEFLLSFKLNMLTVHLRTTRELSKVPAHWELMSDIKSLRDTLAPSTLLVGNGDVVSKQHGMELVERYGMDGVMVGRGIFNDPYLFADLSQWSGASKTDKIELYKRHVLLFQKTWSNNERRVQTLNKFCKVYIQDFPDAKELREKLMNAQSTDELLQDLEAVH